MLTNSQWKKLHKKLEVTTIPRALDEMGLKDLKAHEVRKEFIKREGQEVLRELVSNRREKREAAGLPPVHQQIRNLAGSVGRNVKRGIQTRKIIASDEIQNKRFLECMMCPNYIKEKGRCSACGCFIKQKTKLMHEECPEKKW